MLGHVSFLNVGDGYRREGDDLLLAVQIEANPHPSAKWRDAAKEYEKGRERDE